MALWIQVEQSLPMHRKTLQASRMLRIARSRMIGHVVALWCWGADNADRETGLLSGCSVEQIAAGADWPQRDARRFVDALVGCGGDGHPGFLESGAQGFSIHDWAKHSGGLLDHYEAKKERNRRSQAAWRERKRDISADVSAVSDLRKRPREEERREEERRGEDTPPVPPPRGERLRDEAVCCPQFAASGRFHYAKCPNAQAEAS